MEEEKVKLLLALLLGYASTVLLAWIPMVGAMVAAIGASMILKKNFVENAWVSFSSCLAALTTYASLWTAVEFFISAPYEPISAATGLSPLVLLFLLNLPMCALGALTGTLIHKVTALRF